MRTLLIACLGLLLAPVAQAQSFIGCDPVTNPCNETLYGLGNDPLEGPFLNSRGITRSGRSDGSCAAETYTRHPGQVRIREIVGCDVSATNRCRVEVPQVALDSAIFSISLVQFDLGPAGVLAAAASSAREYAGNIGHRQLSGTCTLDAGEDCALDSDCPSGAGCLSICHSAPGTTCASQADCPAEDCRTEIDWDGIGLCTDETTVCNTDADCLGEDVCIPGLMFPNSDAACVCCQSTSGVFCPAAFGLAEYPAVNCGSTGARFAVGTPAWLFEGGQATPFVHKRIQVPGQQEGVCNGNRSRSCGLLGDIWAGGANGKCTNPAEPCAADPFDPANLGLASPCDDEAFGGTAGDFCDLSENGYRINPGTLNPDGTQNATVCAQNNHSLVGTPGAVCALPFDQPEGDPQPGCRLKNFGLASLPDMDCNGVDDTTEGRCMPDGGAVCSDPTQCPPCANDGDCTSGNCINNGDLCPFIGEDNWFLDSNNDDIGDECQCGEGTGDGAISSPDIAATALCANGAGAPGACDATIIDATGDNATTAEDIGGVVATVNGAIQTSDLRCLRNLDGTQ